MQEAPLKDSSPTELKNITPGSVFVLLSDLNDYQSGKIAKWELITNSEKLEKSVCRNTKNCIKEFSNTILVIQITKPETETKKIIQDSL